MIIGPNGAGKTTLFKMITGQEEPNAGTLKLGDTVQLGYVDQKRPLDPDKTIWEEISDGQDLVLGNRKSIRALMLLDLILVSDQQKKTSQLSGGERNEYIWLKC